MIAVWIWLPKAHWTIAFPAWFNVHHIVWLRRQHWRPSTSSPYYNPMAAPVGGGAGSAGSGTGGNDHRLAFFQALTSMALDILSKSLRRAPFFRVLSAVLILQTMVLFFWRWALLGALASKSWLLLMLAIIGGKWATGSVARLLSLIASGGVLNWAIDQHQQQVERQQQEPGANAGAAPSVAESSNATNLQAETLNDMPEAYRTVDASVYQSVVMEVDENDMDDEDDETEFFWETPTSTPPTYSSSRQRRISSALDEHSGANRRYHHANQHQKPSPSGTVKSLLSAGCTISFGSVVQCGLLGGLAQFVWSQLRKVDAAAAQSAWLLRAWRQQQRREQQEQDESMERLDGDQRGFASMPIETTTSPRRQNRKITWNLLKYLWEYCLGVCRAFVKGHSDWAMAHVAAYYKPYHRAARDVAALVDESGVEPILQQDITTHMCASVGGSLSGIIVLFTGYVLLEDRQSSSTKTTDFQVFQDMLLAFVLCYTLIFTAMESLRASIKAVYVSFAQHPMSLSRSYPLIFQRLRRVSESNRS